MKKNKKDLKQQQRNYEQTKRKLNRYESEQNFALFLMKLICLVVVLLNLVISGFKPYSLPLKNPIVWLNCGVLIYMCIKGVNPPALDNSTNVLPWVMIRILEIVFCIAFGMGDINWITYGILRAIEVLYIVFLVMDQMNFEFVQEEASDDKYADDFY